MEKILNIIFAITCFVWLIIFVGTCIRSRIIDKENQKMESEI